MKESRKQFILKAHSHACSEWKQNIEKEFPKLFKKETLEVGKWYKLKDQYFEKVLICITDIEKSKAYGFTRRGEWTTEEEIQGWTFTSQPYRWYLATEQEIKEALIKEAEKRGIWNVSIIDAKHQEINHDKIFTIEYDEESKTLWSRYGRVFYEGKWAEIIHNTISRAEAEKQLNAKIID